MVHPLLRSLWSIGASGHFYDIIGSSGGWRVGGTISRAEGTVLDRGGGVRDGGGNVAGVS